MGKAGLYGEGVASEEAGLGGVGKGAGGVGKVGLRGRVGRALLCITCMRGPMLLGLCGAGCEQGLP